MNPILRDLSDLNHTYNPYAAAKRTLEKYVLIDREDLPQTTPQGSGVIVDGLMFAGNNEFRVASLRGRAHLYLAAAEFFEANLPVDDEQVTRIMGAIETANQADTTGYIRSDHTRRHAAEALYKAGIRVPEQDNT